MHEVTTFRRDVKTDGRHAVVEFGATLDEDLARRDFTINAIAYRPRTGELRDPFGGPRDLARRLVRAVGDRRATACARIGCARCARSASPRASSSRSSRTRGRAIRDSAPHLAPALDGAGEAGAREDDGAGGARRATRSRCGATSGALEALVPALARRSASWRSPRSTRCRGRRARRGGRAGRLNRLAALFARDPPAAAARDAARLRFSNDATRLDRGTSSSAGTRSAPSVRRGADGGRRSRGRDVRRWVATVGRMRVDAFLRAAAARLARSGTAGLRRADRRPRRALAASRGCRASRLPRSDRDRGSRGRRRRSPAGGHPRRTARWEDAARAARLGARGSGAQHARRAARACARVHWRLASPVARVAHVVSRAAARDVGLGAVRTAADGFVVHEGGRLLQRARRGARRSASVDLFLALTEQLPPAVDVAIDDGARGAR